MIFLGKENNMNQQINDNIIAEQVDRFSKEIEISPVWEDNKIIPHKAVFHTVTEIKKAVADALWREKFWITGKILLKSMRYRVDILESEWKGVNDITYAITREWVQELFKGIVRKENKIVPLASDFDLPIRYGTSVSGRRGSSEYSGSS